MAGKQREATNRLKAYLRSPNPELPPTDVPMVLNAIKTAKAVSVLKSVVEHGLESGASDQARHFADLAFRKICNLLRNERAGMYSDR
jgi:hypothetical protein